jgi:molecular chaperone DnaK (HSP70)
VVQSWPGGSGFINVPSTIRYQNGGGKSWGYQAAKDDPSTIQWFKLLLVDDKNMDDNIRTCEYISSARDAISKAKKQPQEVVKDYLALVWEHIVESMAKFLGDDVVESFPFRVVLTVPATWFETPRASDRLQEAAKEAGIMDHRVCGATQLDVASEPEAAAFQVLRDSREDQNISVVITLICTRQFR